MQNPNFIDCFSVTLHSAGIGRTGVLVTMETAMCLIERNQPVYPLDIVRKMRDQRAMMVQTSVSDRAGIERETSFSLYVLLTFIFKTDAKVLHDLVVSVFSCLYISCFYV